ncbi:MAG: hypothetical protein IJH18_04720 [Bacilli bacterium]|nr:hypothetical protein [Bacilli bacterium]
MKQNQTDNIKNILIHRGTPYKETIEAGKIKKDTDYLRGTIIYDDGRIVVLPYEKTVEQIAQLAKDRNLNSDNFLDQGIVHFVQEKDYKKTLDKLTGRTKQEKPVPEKKEATPKKEAEVKKPKEKPLTVEDCKNLLRQDKIQDKVNGKLHINIKKLVIGTMIGVVVLGNSVFMKGCIKDEPEIPFSEENNDLSSNSDTEEIDKMLASSESDYSVDGIQK